MFWCSLGGRVDVLVFFGRSGSALLNIIYFEVTYFCSGLPP